MKPDILNQFNSDISMDIICFSHLRWNFVYQRPQHLMSRFAKQNRVFLIEEACFNAEHTDYLELNKRGNLTIVIPHLRSGLSDQDIVSQQVKLLKDLFEEENITTYLFWYYTPMALAVGNHFSPDFILYDCMDELSNFKFAPPELKEREKELFGKSDLVFTGGHNLYQAKKDSHHNIHPFPSSIDKEHFAQGRFQVNDPEDQKSIPHPRFGFYGVVDERFDIDLIKDVAEKRPDWQFIILGPVIKIDPECLPRLDNIHYLGGKTYDELPLYLSGWDIAIIPFLRNDSTKYISPTKTPEYLAGGKPVISTSIVDVVTPYGTNKLVHIADTTEEFISAAESELNNADKTAWLQRIDLFLSQNSWDKTWDKMMQLITDTKKKKAAFGVNNNIISILNQEIYV
ncbi:MAG: glycosyltransferase family 1 protein [Bacteroidota bacterium]|nr:glycosyltransferase family 1 protein [Bacteroidota bacterium]